MSVTHLLEKLAAAGIKLSVSDGQLKLRAPKGALTAELREQLAAHKQGILDLLAEESAPSDLSVLPQITPDAASRHQPFPLTDIQQAYWIGAQSDMEFGDVSIHIYTEIHATDLDLSRFIQAWRQVIARHDMLRAVVQKDGTQRILESVPDYEPMITDLRQAAQTEIEESLATQREYLSHGHRSPEVWPGFEVRATLLPEAATRLHFSIDLLHVDGGSLQLLFSDLAAYYTDLDAALPVLELSYRDYVLAEAALHQTEIYQRSLDYWRGRLETLPLAPQLPTTGNANEVRPHFQHGSAVLEKETWSRIKTNIKRFGFSPPAVLLTAYSEALANWSQGDELTVNVTVFNRLPMHPQINEILGDFTSMVLLGSKHAPEATFAERVRQTQENLWRAFDHRHVSGVNVLRELARVRGSAQAAMMPVVFTSFLNLDDEGSSAPSHALRALGDIVYSISQTPQVWIDHQVLEDAGNLLLSWDAVEDLFPAGMIEALFSGYRRLLLQLGREEAWQQKPSGLIAEAELQARTQVNQTETPFPRKTLYDLFAEQVTADANKPALISGAHRLSYGELYRRANRLGHWLRRHGAAPDKLVAVVMNKGPEQVLAALGIHASGAAYLPVDAELPPERLNHLLRDGEVDVVLTQDKIARRLDWPHGLTVLALDSERETEREPETRPESGARPEHLAYVLYTSGSTGLPKGVMIEHRNVVNRMTDIARRFEIGPDDRAIGITALHHDLSVFDIFGVLTSGAALVLPRANLRLDPAHWVELIRAEGITLWNSVPTFLQMLVDYLDGREESDWPTSLRWVILAGDWIPTTLPGRLRRMVPEIDFIASGGPTETTIWDIWNRVGEVDPSWSSIPYGKPLANARYHILHDNLEPCPTWVPGEMYIAGAGLARGYWKNEEASKAFITHPKTGERLYKSGDLGRWLPDGNIEILGRKDHQVKIRGMRIELGEIESTLKRHPAVRNGAVTLTGERFGERKLAAYFVPEEDTHKPDEESLRAWFNDKLPTYMVPHYFIELPSLPMGATGKIDRKALPAPEAGAVKQTIFVAPRNPVEEQIAEVWCEALGLETLSVEANLIDQGLNSLMAIQVNGKLREHFGVELPLRLLLDAPTVAGLARAVTEITHEGGDNTQLPVITPAPHAAGQPFPLNPIQQAYWMGRMDTFELGGVAAQYYLEFEIPPLEMARIDKAWRRVIDRHGMLRAVVRTDGNQQILQEVTPYQIDYTDMRAWSTERAESKRAELRERMAHQVLDASQWPLFEMCATQTEDRCIRFHFHLDLLIADAWSAQIIFDDFRRFLELPDAQPPELSINFRDYLLADQSLDHSELVSTSRAYWRERLDTLPTGPVLPLAMSPEQLDKPRFVRRSFRLDSGVWSSLKRRATEAGLTPSGLLLCAFGEVLARWSRTPGFCINVTTFRRLPLHSEVSAIVGDFTSLTLLEFDGSEPTSFAERARAVQVRLWADLDHRYISGVEVVRELAARQGRSPGVLMPVVFTSLLTRYEGEEQEGNQSEAVYADEIFALSQTPQVWLDHQVIEQNGALVANWDAVEALFDPQLLDTMFATYQELLRELAENENRWQHEALQPLPQAQAVARIAYNATQQDFGKADLHSLFTTRATVQPERIAVVTEREQLTYGQVRRSANRISRWLLDQGVARESLVAVIMEKGWQQVVGTLGILGAGAAYLPIDPSWPADRRAYVMEQAGARCILTQQALVDRLEWPANTLRLAVDAETTRLLDETPVNVTIEPNQLAYVIYTSGSTGRPKGVSITHGAAANTIIDVNRRFGVTADDRAFAISSLSFDLSVYDVFGILAAGGALVIPNHEEARQPEHWLNMIEQGGVTLWNSVPALVDILLEHAANRGRNLSKLRMFWMSGDWIPLDVPGRIRALQPDCKVISMGGATEASIWSIYYEVDELAPEWTSIPYGMPLANQRFHVLDANLRPCPEQVPGELYIGGIGLARDYYGDAEKTAAAYICYDGPAFPGGPEHGERLYRTGDWGRFHKDGYIQFLGREDLQVKVQGYRIELGEVEAVLAAHETVTSAVALVIGEGNARRLVAACVPAEGHELAVETLRAHAAASLTEYMVPSAIAAVEAIPLTANGKVDRKALAEAGFQAEETVGRVAPRTPLESQLAELWRELLETEELGVHDTLFALGGNSLVAIRLLGRLQERFAVAVSLQSLFEKPTIAGLAEEIGRLKAGVGETGSETPALTLQLKSDPDNLHKPFPLSDIQQAYLFGRMGNLELGGVAAHAYFEIEVQDGDPERIRAAWSRLIDRHDMLRAVFTHDGQQRILAELPHYEMPVYDYRDKTLAEIEPDLMALRDELSHQVLPTDQWPLFDVRISRLPSGRMRMHISFDLLIADAWSSQILFLELALFARDPQAVVPPLEVSFRDYMVAVQGLQETELYARSKAYWQERLGELPAAPELPLIQDPATLDAPRFKRFEARLQASAWQRVKERAAEAGISASGLCLAVYAEVLASWSASPEFTVNVTTFNRLPLHEQIQDMVGDFTSLTLLAVDAKAGENFTIRARALQERLWADLDHRHYSGVQVVRDLSGALGRAPGALMPVVYTSRLFSAAGAEEVPTDQPGGEWVYSISQTPQVWLDMQVSEEGGDLTWTWDAVEALFPKGMLERMFSAYLGILERLAEDDTLWQTASLDLLPEDDRLLYAEVNDTEVPYEPTGLYQLVEPRLSQMGEHPAVLTEDDALSYAELDDLSARLASWLAARKVQPGERVAVLLPKGWEQVVATVAIVRAGAAYVPLSPDWPEARLQVMMADAESHLLISREDVAFACDAERFDLSRDHLAQIPADHPGEGADPETLAYVIFTSGTTGRPKGVAIQGGAAVNTLRDINERFAVTSKDRVFGISELTFDLSVYDVFGILAAGATLVLPTQGERRDPTNWQRLLEQHEVTIWNSVPALLEMLLEHATTHASAFPAGLRLALLSGDWLAPDLAARVHGHNPKTEVVSLGGATEASIWSIYHGVEDQRPGWNSVPYGQPLANQRWHVLDARLQERPLLVPGDLYIAGLGLAHSYLGDAEKTRKAFITHPQTGERLYRTGDTGRWRPGGLIEFLGRRDTQVKVQGYRIELGEIEAALSEHPHVGGAVVEALGDPRGQRRLAAYVVPARDENGALADPSIEDLRAHLSKRVPSYMVPAAILFLEQFPLTANGKVNRRALPQPDDAELERTDITLARTPVERQLSELWGELLGLEKVNIHEGLFEMGGNSLIAIRLVSAIKERLGVEVELRTLFEKPTIAEVAEELVRRRAEGGDQASGEELVLEHHEADRYEPFPLNDVQQAYLLGRQDTMELGSVAAHSYTELESETLQPDRIQSIWRRLIEHHDMLRAVVGNDGRQRVIPHEKLPLFTIPIEDLSDLEEDERERRLQATRDELSHQVLPTDQWPLFDIRISRLSAKRIRIHYSFDLLIADAWSSQLLTLQFAQLYADPEATLAPAGVSFRDYLLALDRKEHSGRYRRDRNYWRRRLETLPGAPELPLACDPATIVQPTFVRRHGHLDKEEWAILSERAAGLGVTPSGLLMAAYAEAMATWSRNTAFTLNVTTFNRMPLHEHINNVVGDFTSLSLLAVDTAQPDSDFALRARSVQEQLWADLDHRQYSGVEVIRELARARGQAPGALMPVVFTSRLFRDPRVSAMTESDFPYGEVVYSVSQTPQVWIDSQVLEEGGRLIWSWDVVEELFPVGMMEALFEAHTRLLQELARDPESWRRKHFNLTPEVDLALYAAANDTATDFGPTARTTIDQLVLAQVRENPERIALISEQQTLTYAQLWHGAAHLAVQLREHGVQPNQLVAIVMEKGWQQAPTSLGIMMAGGAYLPISPEWPEQRRDRIIERGGVSIVLTTPEFADGPWPLGVTVLTVTDTLLDQHTDAPEQIAAPDDLAYVIFTSGSTGEPKGVAIEHAAAINTLLDINQRFAVTPDDRVLALSELTFDLSVYDFFGIWAAGAAAVMPPPGARRDPSVWSELGERHGITLWNTVPALLDMLLTYAENNPDAVPSKLRLAMLSGDWLPVDIADRLAWQRPGAEICSLGGATEASIWSIGFPVPVPAPDWPSVPYGKALANQSFHVLDAHMNPRPRYTPGELYIGGVGLAREYYGDAEKTATSFVTHPVTGERLYRTGDMGKYLADGNIEFLGREDNQVKVQGFRIELGEIEAALARFPKLVQSVAAAPRLGEGRGRRLVAYLVPRPEVGTVDVEELRLFLKDFLPDYMIPSTFIELESLPLTPNGKVNRKALPEPGESHETHMQAARTPTEERLCAIWCELLGLERVGIDDNLFDLGGTSVVAIQLLNAIREQFGMELTMRTLFENLTVRGLALAMARARAGGDAVLTSELPSIVPDVINRFQPFPLNDIQQAYWVGRLGAFTMGNLSAHYYVEVDSEDLDLGGFTLALRRMIERHGALRLVFLPDGNQQILEHVPDYEVKLTDLRDKDEAETEAVLMERRAEMSHQVLPADRWPLFDVRATHIDARRTRLHLSFDLLLADAWSFQMMFREMAILAADPNKELEPIEITFRDYVMTERHIAETDLYRRSEAYWHGRIEDMPGAPALPIKDAAQLENPRFERFDGTVPADIWDQFQETASSHGVTTTGALMAAFSEVLATWSGDPRFTLNVTMFNRMPLHPQVNMLLGDFTSMTLVGADTSPMGDEDTFALHARRLQERLWTDLDHGYYGGVKVLREMARRQGRAGAVLMPVVFTSRLFKIAGFDNQTADGGRIGEVVYSISQTPQVWIDHQLTEQEGALHFNWDVVADLFPDGMIEEAFAAYQELLLELAREPESWNALLPALVPKTQMERVAAQNKTTAELPIEPLHVMIERHDAPVAVIAATADGEVRLGYRELRQRAAAVAAWLSEHQVETGEPVAFVAERGWEQLVAVLGCMAAGAAYMPVNPSLPASRRRELLNKAHVRLVLTRSDLTNEWGEGLSSLDVDRITPVDTPLNLEASPEAIACLMAGTAADGKLAITPLSHRALANTICGVAQQIDIGIDDHLLIAGDGDADHTLAASLLALAHGAAIVLPRPGREREANHMQALIDSAGVTIFSGETQHLQALLRGTAGEKTPRLILLSGDSVAAPLPATAAEHWPGVRTLTFLGSPESGCWSLLGEQPAPESETLPMATPLANQRAFVLDVHLRPKPTWVPGDLYIAGDSLAEGYLGDSHRASLVFAEIVDPLDPEQTLRVFRTGHICRYLPDGQIDIISRDATPVLVHRSQETYREAEAVLAAHPNLQEAAVANLPGHDEQSHGRVVAFAVRRQENQVPAGAPPNVEGQLGDRPETPTPDARYNDLHFEPIYTPLERLQFKMEHKWHRRDLTDRTDFTLAAPENESAELERFIHRRSRRRFLDQPVAQRDFASLLELLRSIQPKGVPLPKYRYPSGGGLYPVHTCLSIEHDRIEGIQGGIYYYHPHEHRLHKLHDEPVPHHWHAPENKAIVAPTAFTLFFIGRLQAVSPLYPEFGRDFCFMEAGYMGQLLMDEAPANIGLCPLGGLAFEPVRERFQLDDLDELVHIIVGGSVSDAKRELQEAFLAEQLDARDFEDMNKPKTVVTDAPQSTSNDGDNWQVVKREQPDWAANAIYDPIGRLQFKLARRGVRDGLVEGIELPATEEAQLEADWARRRSYRFFKADQVALADMGHWLACLRSLQPAGMPLAKYRYPSGGGLYPVQTYLHVKAGAVEGLDEGLYYYDPAPHKLWLIAEGLQIPTELQGPPNRPIYETAGFSVFLVAKYGAVAPLYPGLARDFCLLEAGYMGQLLATEGLANGIGVTPLGGMAFEAIREAFELDEDGDLVHMFIGGAVDREPLTLAESFDEGDGGKTSKVEAEDLETWLAERVPATQLPGRIVFLERLPRDSAGRIDRAALPDPDAVAGPMVYEEPESENEHQVADIWREILALEQVGVEQNFFEIGGTSVQMVQLHGRLQEKFERGFPLVDLFEHPSIRTQAQYFEAADTAFTMDESRKQAAKRKAARGRRRGKR